jgi:hypothetical protein
MVMIMTDTSSCYSVTGQLAAPDFAAEHRFIEREREYVSQHFKPRRGIWPRLLRWIDQAPSPLAWRTYDRALQHYADKLDELERAIEAGLLPLKVVVMNKTGRFDRSITVDISVEHGRIRRHRRAPKRPTMVDRPKPVMWGQIIPTSTFWRSGIHVTERHVRASFTRLRPNEGAYVMIDPVYIELTSAARITYYLTSRELPEPQRGEVLIEPTVPKS